jgi:hypothetical protein
LFLFLLGLARGQEPMHDKVQGGRSRVVIQDVKVRTLTAQDNNFYVRYLKKL